MKLSSIVLAICLVGSTNALSLPRRPRLLPADDQVVVARAVDRRTREDIERRYVPTRTYRPKGMQDRVIDVEADEEEDSFDARVLQLSGRRGQLKPVEL